MSGQVFTSEGRPLTDEHGRWNGFADKPLPHKVVVPWPRVTYAMWCAEHCAGRWHSSVMKNPKEWHYTFEQVEDAVHFALRWRGEEV